MCKFLCGYVFISLGYVPKIETAGSYSKSVFKLLRNCHTVLKTDAPFVARDLYELKSEYWNEALTYLGISNVNTTKKERMVTDEVIRNMGGTIASRYSRLEMRRQACEQINKMFGLDIWCNYRADYREADGEIMLTGDTEDNAVKQMVADLNTDTRFRPKERGEL